MKKPIKAKVKRGGTAKKNSSGSGKRTVKRTAGQGVTPRSLLPYLLSFCIVICLGAFVFVGYRAAAASKFFSVSSVEVRGVQRVQKNEIENIVKSETERTGVWDADLLQIKARIEKIAFVRSASVARVLPNRVTVAVVERQPVAVVELSSGPTLFDEEGNAIAPATGAEKDLPFALVGWDETRSPKADKENQQRLKSYRTMLAEWRQKDLLSRVQSVNLKDPRDPIVVTEDSGKRVAIAVGPEQFGENLKNGLVAITGKGDTFEGVARVGANLRLIPRQTK